MFSRAWSSCYTDGSVGSPGFVARYGLWDDRQAATAEMIEAELDKVDLVRVVFCDPHGLARSKTVPASFFRAILRNGMDFSPGPFLFDTGHAVAVDFQRPDPQVGIGEILGAGDFILVPDPRTFQVLPGTEPRTAWVLGDEYLRDGSPHPLATRAVLRRACAQFASAGLAPVVGLEVEWYLTRLLDGPPGNVGNGFGKQGPAPAVAAMNAGYQFNLDTYSDSVADVTGPLSMMLLALGLPLRTMEHESGPGQIETTFGPMRALDAADAMLLFRTVIKQACARRGYHASFMALPGVPDFDPSGWHLHQSVMSTDTGANLFAADGAEGLISAPARAYIDGLLARSSEFCLLSVPTVNGYRRLTPDFVLSPTSADWSLENRSVMVRVLGSGASVHVENRIGEPCANPYLAIASQIFAGLQGLTGLDRGGTAATNRDPDLPHVPTGKKLPQSLREALESFRSSDHARELLGEPLAACLSKLKESEVSRFEEWLKENHDTDGEVTEWEHREYFRVF